MKIEAGKYYRTRNGKKAGIYTVNDTGNYPIHGYIQQHESTIHAWTVEGVSMYFQDYGDNEDDLVSEWEESRPRRIAYVDITTAIIHFPVNCKDLNYAQDNRYIRMPHLDEPESK